MIWNETAIKYVHDRMCNKYKPWECKKCPLERWSGCQVEIMIDEVKEWANKNIPKEVIKNVSRKI